MWKRIVVSRKPKDNNVRIEIKATEKNMGKIMLLEFRKTIHKLNRLSGTGVSFEITVTSDD